MENYHKTGYKIQRGALDVDLIKNIQNEMLRLGNIIEPNLNFLDIDSLWNYFKKNDRAKGGYLYNAFKFLPSVIKLANSNLILNSLKNICDIDFPALVDINCRIDSNGEEKFLFNWHQDYWFSVCSTQAVVVWIPIATLTPELGGLDIISNEYTKGRIFKTRKGESYTTYADAVILEEEIPINYSKSINQLTIGDFLLFKFNTLHKSNNIISTDKSRFSIQLRFADFNDKEFFENKFKPGIVTPNQIDYINK